MHTGSLEFPEEESHILKSSADAMWLPRQSAIDYEGPAVYIQHLTRGGQTIWAVASIEATLEYITELQEAVAAALALDKRVKQGRN